MNIREALKSRGLTEELICEAECEANELRAAGYGEETLEALFESYADNGTIIQGSFTLEKLMMAVDPDKAFAEFWEDINA